VIGSDKGCFHFVNAHLLIFIKFETDDAHHDKYSLKEKIFTELVLDNNFV